MNCLSRKASQLEGSLHREANKGANFLNNIYEKDHKIIKSHVIAVNVKGHRLKVK